MLLHNFKYSFKTLFRNKNLIFWSFAFPIILGTFFSLAFSNIENSEKLNVIDIAIIENETFNNRIDLKEAFNSMGNPNSEEQLFNIKYTSVEKAKELLDNNDITGYITFTDNTSKVTVKQNGINETIVKYVVEQVMQIENMINEISINKAKNTDYIDYLKIYQDVLKIFNEDSNIKDTSSNKMSYTMIEFYTLIAMTCLYGGFIGIVTINKSLANMSNNGKRVAVSPVSKFKLILSSTIAGYLVELIGLALLFLYTIFILGVDYGNNLLLIVLLSLVGSLAGLTLGIFIATIIKGNDNIKIGILMAVTMFGCFLSGMMGVSMKYIIDKNIPILNKINPASMITDGFYSLYYYSNNERYIFNIISLLIFSLLMFGISYLTLRRQKYDSI